MKIKHFPFIVGLILFCSCDHKINYFKDKISTGYSESGQHIVPEIGLSISLGPEAYMIVGPPYSNVELPKKEAPVLSQAIHVLNIEDTGLDLGITMHLCNPNKVGHKGNNKIVEFFKKRIEDKMKGRDIEYELTNPKNEKITINGQDYKKSHIRIKIKDIIEHAFLYTTDVKHYYLFFHIPVRGENREADADKAMERLKF